MAEQAVRAVVAQQSDMAIGSMKMVKLDGHRLVLVRTSTLTSFIDPIAMSDSWATTARLTCCAMRRV